jgi:hypothetical protein
MTEEGLIEKGSSPKRSASSVILREARLRAESKDPNLYLSNQRRCLGRKGSGRMSSASDSYLLPHLSWGRRRLGSSEEAPDACFSEALPRSGFSKLKKGVLNRHYR